MGQTAAQKAWYERNREALNARSREYYRVHKATIEAQKKEYRKLHPEIHDRASKKCRDNLRKQVLLKLGSICIYCGFADGRALQVDHINGDGHLDRKTRSWWDILNDILKNGAQNRYQLLCANCNSIKRIEQKEHGFRKAT